MRLLLLLMFVLASIAGVRFFKLALHLYRVQAGQEGEFFAALTIEIRSGFHTSGLVLLLAILAAVENFLRLYRWLGDGKLTLVILQLTGESLDVLAACVGLSATLFLVSSFFERAVGLRQLRWKLLRARKLD